MRQLLIIFALIAMMAPVMTQPIAKTPDDQVGTADLIILGVVRQVIPPERTNGTVTSLGSAVVHIKNTLRGPLHAQITIVDLSWMTPTHPRRLQVNQERVFFLRENPDGYILADGPLSIFPAEVVDRIRMTIDVFPLEVSLPSPCGPFFYTGQEMTISVRLKNIGASQVGIVGVVLKGNYTSKQLPLALEEDLHQTQLEVNAKNPQAVIIPPKTEIIYPIHVLFNKPAAWHDITPDSFLQTAVLVRACVYVALVLPHTDNFLSYAVYSSPTTTTIGFPLPQVFP